MLADTRQWLQAACGATSSFCTMIGEQLVSWGKLKASGDNTMYPKVRQRRLHLAHVARTAWLMLLWFTREGLAYIGLWP